MLRKPRKAHASTATNTSVFKRPPVLKWNLERMKKGLTPIAPNRISDIILNALYPDLIYFYFLIHAGLGPN